MTLLAHLYAPLVPVKMTGTAIKDIFNDEYMYYKYLPKNGYYKYLPFFIIVNK
jgi:hypothetical protein